MKLEGCAPISDDIAFAGLDDAGKFTSQIVFSKSMDLVRAIKLTYRLAIVDSVKEVATTLRNYILYAFRKNEKLPWLPTAEYLQAQCEIVPEMLQRFLKVVLSGDDEMDDNIELNRLVLSVRQDIRSAATNGR